MGISDKMIIPIACVLELYVTLKLFRMIRNDIKMY